MYGIYDGTEVIARFAAPLSVTTDQPIFASDALSLKRSVRRRPGQRWVISANLVPLSTSANKLFAMLTARGHSEIIQAMIPQNYATDFALKNTANVNATGSKGSGSVNLSGLNGVIPAGRFVRFSSHSKVYMIKEDTTGGAVGIYPQLVADVSGSMSFKNVLIDLNLEPEVSAGMKYTDGILMDLGEIKLTEAV